MDKNLQQLNSLLDIVDDLNNLEEDNKLQGFCKPKFFKLIISLLKKKIVLQDKTNKKLDRIIDLLKRKVEQEDIIIDQLDTKIALETPQPPVVCQCQVTGTGTGDLLTPPAFTGQLDIDVCPQCTVMNSNFMYNAFNPANQSVREVRGITFNEVNCDLDPATNDGSVNITGTGLIRVGIGGPFRAGDFILNLVVINLSVSSFTIVANSVSDTVINIPANSITVADC